MINYFETMTSIYYPSSSDDGQNFEIVCHIGETGGGEHRPLGNTAHLNIRKKNNQFIDAFDCSQAALHRQKQIWELKQDMH